MGMQTFRKSGKRKGFVGTNAFYKALYIQTGGNLQLTGKSTVDGVVYDDIQRFAAAIYNEVEFFLHVSIAMAADQLVGDEVRVFFFDIVPAGGGDNGAACGAEQSNITHDHLAADAEIF